MGMLLKGIQTEPDRRTELVNLYISCGTASSGDCAVWLLRAYRIFEQGNLPRGMTLADYEGFHAQVGAAAFESAALTFLDEASGYMVSRGPGGTCMATVILPDAGTEATAEGETVALALIKTFAAALLTDDSECAANPVGADPHESAARH